MAHKLIDKILNLLLFCMTVMIITGGGIFRIGRAKIEFASVSAWAGAFFVLSLFAIKVLKVPALTSHERMKKFFNRLQNPHFFWAILIFSTSIILTGHLFRHWSLNTDGADVSFVHQSLNFMFSPIPMKCDLCLNQTFFGEHVALTFYLLSFFTWMQSDELIIIFEVFFTMATIVTFFKYGPLQKSKQYWAICLLFILSHITLRNGLMWDFREDHLGLGFYLLFMTFFFRKNYITAMIFFLLTLISKENFAFITIAFPAILWFEKDLDLTSKQRIGWSILLTALSLLWIVISFKLIIPHFNQGVETGNNIVSRFPGLGSTPKEVVINLITKPILLFNLLGERLFHLSTLKYLATLLLPFALFIYRRWWWLVAALPVLMMNLLSFNFDQRMMIFHYELMLLPILIFPLALEFKKTENTSYKYLWGFIIVLMFSSKWPGFYVTKYFPSVNDFKNISFFNELPNQGILGTSRRLMAQTNHVYEQRSLRIPHALTVHPEVDWLHFQSFNTNKEHPRDRNNSDITYMLLDSSVDWDAFLIAESQKYRWEIVSTSSDKRFYYMRKSHE